jgi:hypothetical protein
MKDRECWKHMPDTDLGTDTRIRHSRREVIRVSVCLICVGRVLAVGWGVVWVGRARLGFGHGYTDLSLHRAG